MNKKLQILTRIFLSTYILILISLRYTYPIIQTNQTMITNKWFRLLYSKYYHFLPSPEFIVKYDFSFVKINQIFDIILVFLILVPKKIGPILLILKIILGTILETIVQKDIFRYLSDSRVSSEIFREIGIIGTTLLLT